MLVRLMAELGPRVDVTLDEPQGRTVLTLQEYMNRPGPGLRVSTGFEQLTKEQSVLLWGQQAGQHMKTGLMTRSSLASSRMASR